MTSRIHHYEIRQSLLVMSLVMLLTGCQRGLPGQYPPLPGEGGVEADAVDPLGDGLTLQAFRDERVDAVVGQFNL